MELIKKIKQTESQAQEIIEKAKAEAAQRIEKDRVNGQKLLAEAEQQRKKATEVSIAAAQSQGRTEVERLKTQSENQRRELRDKVSGKIAGAAAKVVDYLSSH
jgi:V/A-type H+-transporting ATPase subunit G/H